MRKWRDFSQEEMVNAGRIWPERMEEEVLDKYKVEDSKREATRWNGGLLAEARTTE